MSYTQFRVENFSYPHQYAGTGIFQNNDDMEVNLIKAESMSNGDVGNGINKVDNSKMKSEISLLTGIPPMEKQQIKEQQRMILNHLQHHDEFDSYDSNDTTSSNSSIFSYDDMYDHKIGITTTTTVTTTITTVSSHKSTPSLSKLMSFGLKGKLNRSRGSKSPKHVRMLSELKIPAPKTNESILFMSKVQKLNSSSFKKSSNNFLVLTKRWLCSFKNAEKVTKIFPNSTRNINNDNDDINDSNSDFVTMKTLPSENLVLSLATVYAASEKLIPDPHIRIDFILGPKEHDHVTIVSQDTHDHDQWLTKIRLAIRNADSVGPYLTLSQREWLMKKLKILNDLVDENENNFVCFRVLLKALIDEDPKKENNKDPNIPVIFILGRNNIYLIPFELVGNDLSSNDGDNKKQTLLFLESIKPKEIEFRKFQYPLLCLTSIQSVGKDDTCQLTFKNSAGTKKRSLIISSMVIENIITEIRTAIDSITFWWPSPGYHLIAPTNMQATIIPPERDDDNTSHAVVGFDRMLEAQCHANRVNRSRISFNIEYVLGSENILGLEINNLPFRFILLPPIQSEQSGETYSNQELLSIFNSLRYHPLLHEIILRDTSLFELQILPGPKDHKGKGTNMLGAVLYDILLSNPRLVKLDLTSCGITSSSVSAIGQAFMTGQSCLERLLLGDNYITREGAQALASGITGHKSAIKELDISNCKLTHDSIESILHALDTNDPSKLEVLNLSNNICKMESNILTELLSKTISLRTLNLSNCQNIFASITTPVISTETLGNTQLTTLNLGGVSLNDINHVNALCTYIQSSSFEKLRFFNVDNCNLDGEMVAIVLSYVTTSPNHKKMRVWAGGNHVTRTKHGCKEFCNSIRNNWTPTWLSLSHTKFGSDPEMIDNISQAFCENTVIEYLDLSYPDFKPQNSSSSSRTVRTTRAANKACEAIGKIFKENKSIRELHLNGDPERRFGSFLGANLLELRENCSLEKLSIKGNAIGDQGARVLSEVLKNNIKLRALDCDENEIGIEGYNAINNVFSSGLNTVLQRFAYPTQDLETYNENLNAKLGINTTKMSQRIALENEKVSLHQVIDEIMISVKRLETF